MNINASLFVQMVVFFIGAWIVMKYIWPPLIRAIEERQKKIADGLAAADKGKNALVEAEQRGQTIEAEARVLAKSIVGDGEKRGQAIVEEAKAQAKVEADRIIESAKVESAAELAHLKDALRAQVGSLVVAAAEQILSREVDAKVHTQLLEQLKAKL